MGSITSKLALGCNALLFGGLAVITANHVDMSRAAYEAAEQRRTYCERSGMVPAPLRCVITQAAHKMPAVVLAAVAKQESGFRVDVCSKAGACGLFQFMPETALAYSVDRACPESSARGADKYLATLERRFGNLGLALAAYNWGQGNVSAWRKRGAKPAEMPAETRAYVFAITGHGIDAWTAKNKPGPLGGHIASLEREMRQP